MAAVIQDPSLQVTKPELVFKIDGLSCNVNDAIFIPGRDSIVTGSEDRTLRIWVRRDTGKFWPTVIELLPSPVTCITYSTDSHRLFVGLDNGTVVEYDVSEDLNHVEHKRDYLSHTARVTGIICTPDMSWIVSASKDRSISWYSTNGSRRICEYSLEHSATCLEYDVGSHYVFVGDSSGRITLLSINQVNGQVQCRVIRELRGHEQSVSFLAWDSTNSRLFSCSADHSVIFWDIGGAKGSSFELQGHTKEVSSICWWSMGASLTNIKDSKYKGLLISGGLDGYLIFWFMDPSRVESPNWSESDICHICSGPFFWNVRKMWNNMSVGVRQHHCRRCGHAVCDKCSPYRSNLPCMGFEKDVRICSQCFPLITDADRRSLAISFDARHPVTCIRVEESLNLLLTVGKDRVIKVWDIKAFSSISHT
ncbi:WD repeat and FYVE domain-containing protein [Schistosoma japonicum]|uniref:WD repeat and FYVE domain-containing protein n=1 Tax=Schistosoma japonicum TaxID=6182 RepID=A0A4Z2DXP0_SCHJA|nr:WD repeat and FYVE domain-containing protein [Schistosoma japonicum]